MKTPWHLWIVGLLSLLWNLVGAFDYTATNLGIPWYVVSLTPDQLAYFNGLPGWVVASWAIAVWGGVLGSLLLLLSPGRGVLLFALSLLGMAGSFTHGFLLSDTSYALVAGPNGVWFSLAVFGIGIFLLLYSRAMGRRATRETQAGFGV